MNRRRIAGGVAACALVTGVVATATTAQAAGSAPASSASITAKTSDATPASGQQFVVTGKVTGEKGPLGGRSVAVQSLRDGKWTQLTGAVVTTRSDGTYRVRVILSAKGLRTMRVLADAPGRSLDAAKRFTVTVH